MVSVIIPVYNVENYVEKTLKSVINQTYKDLEIIVIDDGSTDRSPEIVDRIAQTDERIRVFHTKNGGVSAARNKGLDIAKGRYVAFLDSDDFIEPDMYEKMVVAVEKNNCDAVQCSYYTGDVDNSVEREVPGLYRGQQAVKLVLRVTGASVCNKLFSSTVLSDVRFKENLSIGEDRIFNIDAFSECSCVTVIDDILYHYVQRDTSAMHAKLSRKNIDGLLFYDYLIEKAQGDDELVDLAIREKAGSLIFYLELMIVQKTERSLIDEVEKRILEMKDRINRVGFVSLKQKIAFKALFLSPKLYETMVRAKHLQW